MYDKSEGKISQGKIQPAGALLNGKAIMYFKLNYNENSEIEISLQ